MMNVRIHDNGAAYMITVNGLIVHHTNSLGGAWKHIEWMFAVASQEFTVGDKELPVREWLDHKHAIGFLDK